jgi:hypothetical protein
MSEASDFFDPVCVEHVLQELPLVSKLLGLPPGYRFLIASDQLDVWYDERLLQL